MSTFKMFAGIFLMAAGIYVLSKLIPPYYESYQFQDAVKDEATHDTYSPKSEAEIRTSLLKKAQEFDIPIGEDDIKVMRSGQQYNGVVSIQAAYVVHVDLPGYPLDLHFDASTENKGVF
ncbi:MAG: DUF4845 domain-containing protein [Acidobacteria bacterium]|nr:DUF4845 domain-containing protein [Acidobacteriota bacterium]MBV9626008.1 DUF4845 domain-containing protein [Acidobacteriota bacterium]